MKTVPRKELIKARDKIANRQAQLDALIAPLSKKSDSEKLFAILELAKSLNDPTVAEGAVHASNILNGKGIYLRRTARDVYKDGNFGILPNVVLVTS